MNLQSRPKVWLLVGGLAVIALVAMAFVTRRLQTVEHASQQALANQRFEQQIALCMWRLESQAAVQIAKLSNHLADAAAPRPDWLPADNRVETNLSQREQIAVNNSYAGFRNNRGGLPTQQLSAIKGNFDVQQRMQTAGAYNNGHNNLPLDALNPFSWQGAIDIVRLPNGLYATPAPASGSGSGSGRNDESGTEAGSDVLQTSDGMQQTDGFDPGMLQMQSSLGGPTPAPEPETQRLQLDEQQLIADLTSSIQDLLPRAKLLPVTNPEKHNPTRLMAAMPLVLDPGPMPLAYLQNQTNTGDSWPVVFGAQTALALALLALVFLIATLLKINKQRSHFVAAVSHEMRTPLTTFKMYSEMLDQGMVPVSQQNQYFQTLNTEANRLQHLVENVLAHARLEKTDKPKQPSTQTMTLQDALAPILPRLQQHAEAHGLQWQGPQIQGSTVQDAEVENTNGKAPAAACNPTIQVDPSSLDQILTNLVDNACKYAHPAEPPLLVLSILQTNPDQVTLTLQDHGPGIPQDVAHTLFKPFRRSQRHIDSPSPGLGLGLSISRQLAQAMGGDLKLQPKQNPTGSCTTGSCATGACFAVVLKTV